MAYTAKDLWDSMRAGKMEDTMRICQSGIIPDINGNVVLSSVQRLIHIAVLMKNPAFIKLMLEQGADINLRNDNGQTPLDLAIEGDDYPSAKFLIESGADVSARGNRARTALHHAAELERINIIDALIDAGADVNAMDEEGLTPFHLAVARERYNGWKLLLQNGADINAKDHGGRTPLYMAVARSSSYISELIKNGADMYAEDIRGAHIIGVALNNNDQKTVQIFINNGFDIEVPDSKGMTPLKIATQMCNEPLVIFLKAKIKGINEVTRQFEIGDHLIEEVYNFDKMERFTFVCDPKTHTANGGFTREKFSSLDEADLSSAFAEHARRGGKKTIDDIANAYSARIVRKNALDS